MTNSKKIKMEIIKLYLKMKKLLKPAWQKWPIFTQTPYIKSMKKSKELMKAILSIKLLSSFKETINRKNKSKVTLILKISNVIEAKQALWKTKKYKKLWNRINWAH